MMTTPTRMATDHHRLCWLIWFASYTMIVSGGNELWPLDRPDGMPTISSLEVMCGKDHMDVHMTFTSPFEGIVSSKGQHSDPRCVYVPPASGKNFFTFRIAYGRCGTKPDLHGQFYENTVVVQYDKDLLEVWDEAKRLRCEWFNDYEKTASKPPMVIADLDVIQLDFRGDNVDCWMEIQHGKGPWAAPVSGIVPLGSTLTLVVAINDYRGEFDMRVKSCVASDGAGHIIKLTDEYGCVLRPKMISRFLKARAPNEKATVITYAFFHAFKFPDALSVHIKCKVEICRHGCLDHCQLTGNVNERKDTIGGQALNQKLLPNGNELGVHPSSEQVDDGGGDGGDALDHDNGVADTLDDGAAGGGSSNEHDVFYDDLINSEALTRNVNGANHQQQQQQQQHPTMFYHQHQHHPLAKSSKSGAAAAPTSSSPADDRFPHGPRQLEAKDRIGLPSMAGPRALDLAELERQQQRQQSMFVRPESANANDGGPVTAMGSGSVTGGREGDASATPSEEPTPSAETPSMTRPVNVRRRVRRTVRINERHVRSADVGVSGLYDVISEADLAFSPETRQEAVTVFQGKISEEIVYGICMPVPGFSVLFIVVASAAIVSALVAGSLLYRYRVQKETLRTMQQQAAAAAAAVAAHHGGGHHCSPVDGGTLASWMTMRLFRMGRSSVGVDSDQCGSSTSEGGIGANLTSSSSNGSELERCAAVTAAADGHHEQ